MTIARSELPANTPHAIVSQRPQPGGMLGLGDGRRVIVVNVNGRGARWMHVKDVVLGNVFIMTWEVSR